MKTFLLPYKGASEGCKLLAKELGIRRIALENSKFVGDANTMVINWGSSEVSDEVKKCKILNKPEAVKLASNKLHTFNKLDDTGLMPAHTTDVDTAREWIEEMNSIIVERHKLTGNSGEGIRLVEEADDLQECPLYVLYVPKKQEYRVHVLNGAVVDVQRKARRKEVPDDQINWRIRNHDNGFVFARHEELGEVPPQVLDYSVQAVRRLGLDFGAVDVVFNDKQRRAYVLEVNTAPGLSGTTLEGYAGRFKQIIGGDVPQPVEKRFIRAPWEAPQPVNAIEVAYNPFDEVGVVPREPDINLNKILDDMRRQRMELELKYHLP